MGAKTPGTNVAYETKYESRSVIPIDKADDSMYASHMDVVKRTVTKISDGSVIRECYDILRGGWANKELDRQDRADTPDEAKAKAEKIIDEALAQYSSLKLLEN